jgi:lysophospholipase L1-like esterase
MTQMPYDANDKNDNNVQIKMYSRLVDSMLTRSRKSWGNVHRFRNFLCRLYSGQKTTTVVMGGSNCHPKYLPLYARGSKTQQPWYEKAWPGVLADWLNEEFPLENGERHLVINLGMGGAGSCAFARRIPQFLNESLYEGLRPPDLVFVEFGINDAEFAEQHEMSAPPWGGHYTPVAECYEIMIRSILRTNDEVALVALELPAWDLGFSTAGELHQTIINFYQIPYLSLKDAIWPALRSRSSFFANLTTEGVRQLYWPKDGTHMMQWGHHALVDVIAHFIEFESRPMRAAIEEAPELPPDQYEPVERVFFGDLKDSSKNTIAAPSKVVKSQTTYQFFRTCLASSSLSDMWWKGMPKKLKEHLAKTIFKTKGQQKQAFKSMENTDGWAMKEEKGKFGWVCDTNAEDESITFEVGPLPARANGKGYIVKLGFLRSYENMAVFEVTGREVASGKSKTVRIDGLWQKRISIYQEADVFVSASDCAITIKPLKARDAAAGNKVKVIALMAVNEA